MIDIGDEILAVTCKYTLWLDRSKKMKNINFEGKLKEWKMVVINDPSQYVILCDLINANSAAFDKRLMILSKFIIPKEKNDAFSNPRLDSILNANKVNKLFIVA